MTQCVCACVCDEYSLRENPGLIILCKYVSVTYKLCSRVYTVSSPLCYGEKCNISALYFLCHSLLFSVKDVFECVWERDWVCAYLPVTLTKLFSFWSKNNRLLYLWMVFFSLVPWFNVPCLSASQKCCIYYMPQRLCNCIILLYVPLFLTFFLCSLSLM